MYIKYTTHPYCTSGHEWIPPFVRKDMDHVNMKLRGYPTLHLDTK